MWLWFSDHDPTNSGTARAKARGGWQISSLFPGDAGCETFSCGDFFLHMPAGSPPQDDEVYDSKQKRAGWLKRGAMNWDFVDVQLTKEVYKSSNEFYVVSGIGSVTRNKLRVDSLYSCHGYFGPKCQYVAPTETVEVSLDGIYQLVSTPFPNHQPSIPISRPFWCLTELVICD